MFDLIKFPECIQVDIVWRIGNVLRKGLLQAGIWQVGSIVRQSIDLVNAFVLLFSTLRQSFTAYQKSDKG
ncbi:MAG: hypothetical protein WCR58_11420 [Bacteroidales bacterium]|jgi:hypothetical protein|nr:hypothetical protein [Bacteroidales bacterium]